MNAPPKERAAPRKALPNIPPFPAIAVRLVQSLTDETTRLKELVELIQADPKLSVDVLQRANSPLYGLARQVDSVRDALVLLGFDTVRKMALTAATGTYAEAAK